MRKNKIKEGAIEKYLEVLNELYDLTSGAKPCQMNLSGFMREHQVSGKVCTNLKGAGIIKEAARDGQLRSYQWDSIEPNKAMVIKLLNSLNDDQPWRANKLLKRSKKKREIKSRKLAITIDLIFFQFSIGFEF
jgi:hypothetical protein